MSWIITHLCAPQGTCLDSTTCTCQWLWANAMDCVKAMPSVVRYAAQKQATIRNHIINKAGHAVGEEAAADAIDAGAATVENYTRWRSSTSSTVNKLM